MTPYNLANVICNAVVGAGRWLSGQFSARWRRYHIMETEDLPDRLNRRTLYVVTEGRRPVYAALACPRRRCGDTLNLNLLPDDLPLWALTEHPSGIPSLDPSIWRRNTCGCHFWLREGRIIWCRGTSGSYAMSQRPSRT